MKLLKYIKKKNKPCLYLKISLTFPTTVLEANL